MTVLSTEIQGRILRAQAGAMQAVIGAQRPAWLNIVVRPRIESRKLRLELVSAEFPIESDNWYVTEPNGVDVFPLPMLRDRISQRLTDGLYAKRGEIEQQVAAGVPKLLAQIEERALAQTDRVVTFGRWPMPVWQPRAKLWPSAVSIDSRGLTLSLGVTLAALVSNSDPVPLRKHAGPAHAPAMSTGGVQISMARDVVRIWTELLAASDVRRFHVNDFHAEDFHRLADRDFLSQVMPGLIDRRGTTELRSVLSFEQPMLLEPVDQDDSSQKQTASSQMRLTGRELRLTISERAAREAPWTALAEFPLAWSQDFQIEMEKVSHRRRKVLLSSVTRPRVESSGRVLKLGVKPNQVLRHQLVAEQFRKGWEATFATALAKQIALPERVISGISLACDNLGVQDDYLVIQLAQPTTQIRNLSAVPLTYQVRHETSGWSLPQILQPGMLHDYRSAGPLTWRCRVDDREFLYTLPAGSVSHYRGGERPLLLVPDRPIPEVAGWPDVLIR